MDTCVMEKESVTREKLDKHKQTAEYFLKGTSKITTALDTGIIPTCSDFGLERTLKVDGYKNLRLNSVNKKSDGISRYQFDKDLWEDRGDYWLNKASQTSDIWRKNHINRLTASNFGNVTSAEELCTLSELALHLTNLKPFKKADLVKINKMHGVKTEPEARNWYCKRFKVKVVEVGLAVPKWEPRIGASLDGEVVGTDGMIEIKSPLEMYKSLQDHINKINSGWKPSPFYHNHIWNSHYAQIQGSLKITNKKWCDYVVYATKSNKVYVERIYFDQVYWNTILWPCIKSFLDNVLEPIISKN